MQSSRPLFVIVSGAPGSGKTTLARRGLSEPELTAGHEADVRVVHCVAEPATIDRRYGVRAVERHPAHLDAARQQDVMRELLDGRYEPLNIDAQLLIVRTDDGYEPCYEEVCAFVAAGAAA